MRRPSVDATTTPRIRIDVRPGSAEVVFRGQSTTVAGSTLDDVRRAALAVALQIARAEGETLAVDAVDPEGEWPLVVGPDGSVQDRPEPPRRWRKAAAALVTAVVVGALIFTSYAAFFRDDPGSADTAGRDGTQNSSAGENRGGDQASPRDAKPKDPGGTKPRADGPRTGPQSGKPKSTAPKNGKPKSGNPKNSKPKNSKPKNSKPKNSKPKNSKPKNDGPKSGNPKNSKPRNSRPRNAKPRNAQSRER